MEFDPSFFKPEFRDGFYIKSMMKRAWASQMKVLVAIDAICKRHNLQYFADLGTLLGAVRHKGFIPWDDDLDIGMRRVDFAKFAHYAKTELPEDFFVVTVTNHHDYINLIARVMNGTKISTHPDFLERFYGCPYAVGVDIFIYDNLPANPAEEEIMKTMFTSSFALAKDWDSDDMTQDEKLECLSQLSEYCNQKFDMDGDIKHQLFELSDRITSMFWNDDNITDIAVISDYLLHPKYRHSVSCFESTIDVPFECITIPIPVGYDEILCAHYGPDYMTPIHRSSSHGYPFYKAEEDILFNKYREAGIEIPNYLKE